MSPELFELPPRRRQEGRAELDQYFTPEWAAVELVAELFPDLSAADLVIEPSCGKGAFLKAIPPHVPAIGVEIDPELAAEARTNTLRQIITGDFREVELPQATAMVGNPPFNMATFDQFLVRADALLPEGCAAAFLLPSYAVQTPSRVLRWADVWSLRQWIIPRTLFPRARLPLVMLRFTKEPLTGSYRSRLQGFALYAESAEIGELARWARETLTHGEPGRPTWQALVREALTRLGGRAKLADIYGVVDKRRPQGAKWWKEKVRQTLQRHFASAGNGEWSAA